MSESKNPPITFESWREAAESVKMQYAEVDSKQVVEFLEGLEIPPSAQNYVIIFPPQGGGSSVVMGFPAVRSSADYLPRLAKEHLMTVRSFIHHCNGPFYQVCLPGPEIVATGFGVIGIEGPVAMGEAAEMRALSAAYERLASKAISESKCEIRVFCHRETVLRNGAVVFVDADARALVEAAVLDDQLVEEYVKFLESAA